MTGQQAEIGDAIEGPFESNRVHHGWVWQRPNGAGDLGYSRPDVLLRCARIFGGRVVVYRTVTNTTTTVHDVPQPCGCSCTCVGETHHWGSCERRRKVTSPPEVQP